MSISLREKNEIDHGLKLSESGAELIWGWESPAGKVRFQRRVKWIIEHSQLNHGMKALEIGCGTGNFTEYFSASGAEILALDISNDLLTYAKNRHLPENVRFICMPFEELDMPNTFDAIIGSSVLHHLDIKPALMKIYQLLKPGGIMAFAEPNMLNPQIMIQKNIPWVKQHMGDSPDETAYFRWHMNNLLVNTGFCNIKVIPLDFLHPAIPEYAISFFRKIESFLEEMPLLREFAGSLYICAYRS